MTQRVADKAPSFSIGGKRPVGSSAFSAGYVIMGNEFGSKDYKQFPRRSPSKGRGNRGWWLYPAMARFQPTIAKEWLAGYELIRNAWTKSNPPACEFIIQSWDTAFTKNTRSDFSACTTWGVFYREDEDTGYKQPNVILLNAYKERLEFPELKEKAVEEYKDWNPDACIIEAKAAGAPLVFELRAMGIPVTEYTPSRGNDKIARVNAVSDLFASGIIWAPETRWAEEVIEEFAAFPAGEHDDLVDSSTQALLRFRQGGFIRIGSDEEDKPLEVRTRAYY